MRWGTKAYQPDVCAVESDQHFFNLLRMAHDNYRSRSRWSWLKKVQSIDFVKFELFRNQLASICNASFSPIGPDHDFQGADTEPPIGPNLMMHLFENPDHADILPVLFRRIPRRMKERLQPCPQKGSSLGWGVQFVEVLNGYYVFLFGCVGFMICSAVAISWTVAKDDI
ncbi:hypothetical protein Cob_v009982 [Colletotrichum orbiculare MAFF 240422]|uniref:Uncharacterized protein n=1 Tax=Colletotrichum orbiculare (strain 104-T / ATCC 96160 / CBS 514.97 / LARS 414 / MAFF 240422) TaxID=1213857 RepID=N4UUX7_COLOR|nr:hypothetical protein Cob_v009982 [Colletotrichum orbiculare MAFF 240422]